MSTAGEKFRLNLKHYENVRSMLGYGVVRIRSQVPHKFSLDWLECEVLDAIVANDLRNLGAEKV